MAVDLAALKKISEGDPSSRVTVTRRWLAEVHRCLAEAEQIKSSRSGGNALFDQIFGGKR